MRLISLAFALVLGACAPAPGAPDAPGRGAVPEPAGYWTGPMGGPVPATIAGGRVIDTARLAGLIAKGNPVLVDVGPMPHKPDNFAADAWAPPPHRTIPGSIWLPGAGAGDLPPQRDVWYRSWLQALTGGNPTRPLVVFCHPDCWGSWNAARRAIRYGYANVLWYEEGIEGWQDSGRETQEVQPELPPS